mmetsp:Transcript_28436/g.62569  ORF Transcript_28436/g.62569 Transcript_28436/m.62569 type:complete len:191 (+) Transcript_28436:820-1392(+)
MRLAAATLLRVGFHLWQVYRTVTQPHEAPLHWLKLNVKWRCSRAEAAAALQDSTRRESLQADLQRSLDTLRHSDARRASRRRAAEAFAKREAAVAGAPGDAAGMRAAAGGGGGSPGRGGVGGRGGLPPAGSLLGPGEEHEGVEGLSPGGLDLSRSRPCISGWTRRHPQLTAPEPPCCLRSHVHGADPRPS